MAEGERYPKSAYQFKGVANVGELKKCEDPKCTQYTKFGRCKFHAAGAKPATLPIFGQGSDQQYCNSRRCWEVAQPGSIYCLSHAYKDPKKKAEMARQVELELLSSVSEEDLEIIRKIRSEHGKSV